MHCAHFKNGQKTPLLLFGFINSQVNDVLHNLFHTITLLKGVIWNLCVNPIKVFAMCNLRKGSDIARLCLLFTT